MLTSEPLLRNRSISSFMSYALTVLLVGAAAALRWALGQVFDSFPPYVTFYPATILSALLGGIGPGLLATGFGALIAAWAFFPPVGSVRIELFSDAVGLAFFCSGGVLISLTADWLQAARTKAEIARQSEERFRALADSIAQLAWMADEKGLAFWYNRRWYDYTGATVEEMEGSGWQKLYHPDHAQRVAEKMSHCLKNGEVWEDTIPLRGKDGQYRWFFSTAIPILDKAGRVWRWFGTHTDVTRQREAEQALRRYDLLAGQSRDIILFIRRDNGRILEANAAAVNAYGYTHEELLTLTIYDLRGGDTQGLIAGQMAEADARSIVFETVHRHKDGSPFPVEASWRVATIDGTRTLICVIRDTTERKRAQEVLADRTVQLERMNRELSALNAELDDFTHMASHDLQEPLRTLTVFSDVLRKDLGTSLPERADQDLAFITDAAKRMQTLVRNLLALARAGRVAKKREKVSLSECADLALEALSTRVQETGAKISRDKLPDVWGDSTLLTELYQNLIGSALKFNGDQSPIIQLTLEEREGEQILGVKDNGIGIEPKYAQRIFRPFMRLHGRSDYEGSGIGLAICRKIVERHGGKIWVESESGKGAHFRFTISLRGRER